MVKLHPRTMRTSQARARFHTSTLDFCTAHELTDTEMLEILLYVASRFNTLVLRAERHPGDPDKKADEA